MASLFVRLLVEFSSKSYHSLSCLSRALKRAERTTLVSLFPDMLKQTNCIQKVVEKKRETLTGFYPVLVGWEGNSFLPSTPTMPWSMFQCILYIVFLSHKPNTYLG